MTQFWPDFALYSDFSPAFGILKYYFLVGLLQMPQGFSFPRNAGLSISSILSTRCLAPQVFR